MDMSFIQFTTEILNIKEDLIEDLQTIKQSDGCLIIKIKLKNTNSNCPYYKSPCKVHGYYQRKLKHASLANRECVIIYSQRRYRCLLCELTFSENNPFTCYRGELTYETKINILKRAKVSDQHLFSNSSILTGMSTSSESH